ncbi:MAG: CpsB/CapC family capsule biosynthesis tyrosine phosphatase [Bacteroidota bacterium]|nr:CpsB/CapC family capsule biosynthesis tyrosine phosphatase [Bacteroidota bacterium]
MLKWFLKNKEQELAPLDFSVLKTDMHSHLIPDIDDGASDLEASISMLKKLQQLGYQKIVTTPHIMSDFYKNTPEIIAKGLEAVKVELKKQNINIKLEAAAEYYVDYDFKQKIGKEKLLTFGDNYILIEFSFLEAPVNLLDIIFTLQLEGYKVVLAHPERYSFFEKKDYEDFKTRGVLLQLNLLSLIGHYSTPIQEQAEWLIDQNMISFIGTDCHNMNHANLYEKCQTKKAWHDLLNSGKLLNNTL